MGEPDNGSGPAPIFIGGAGRSGTTLMRILLDSHPNICCGPELKVLPRITQVYDELAANAMLGTCYDYSVAELQGQFREHILGLVANFRRASGKPRWAEKTPNNVTAMVGLGAIFPRARFVHMVRDGRDVACSLLATNWIVPATGQKLAYTQSIANAARYWREMVERGFQQSNHPSLAGRVIAVRYEGLVTQTAAVMRDVLSFLAEPWDDTVLSFHDKDRDEEREVATQDANRPIDQAPIGRWLNEMSEDDKSQFKREAGRLLVQLGYAGENW